MEITKQPESNFRKKRGIIVFTIDGINNMPEDLMKEIYSNFFPVAIETPQIGGFHKSIVMFGYSPNFKEIEDSDSVPQYNIKLEKTETGMKFEKMIEVVPEPPITA
jgi:hypothetical protein